MTGYSQFPYPIIRLDSSIYIVSEALRTDNGDFIIAGNNQDFESNKRFFIAKINEAGELIRKKNYPGVMDWLSSLIKRSDGNYFIIMAGENNTGFLLETNSKGDSIWSWTIPASSGKSRLGPIRESSDGTFILAENIYDLDYAYPPIESNYFYLNSDGSVNFQFDASSVETNDIEVVSGNEFISTERDNPAIIKYNTSGNIVNVDTCVDIDNNYISLWKISKLSGQQLIASGNINTSIFPQLINNGLISVLNDDGSFAYCSKDSLTDYIDNVIPVDENRLI
jgi:hypothetical protein